MSKRRSRAEKNRLIFFEYFSSPEGLMEAIGHVREKLSKEHMERLEQSRCSGAVSLSEDTNGDFYLRITTEGP
jgi:hypothetical protein